MKIEKFVLSGGLQVPSELRKRAWCARTAGSYQARRAHDLEARVKPKLKGHQP
ncbi:uncharacterized protein CANTADRAFT_116747 [Suhomyces tanzawaensis NRRL Y-17324]|uniref:Uncharacterized protein n=1 Tax=Suhomyces tanzawaensis NRRL Y-17324 TaxID=984487 RepID=A0A1E4SQ89_9ASCO|nr:uncharacterized protein CANTADRAFT_116747 [Suhomyces tanzawaensis NRRL Y-17324]ODV81680.1 hypothetical protein CANTADRAFT_116747 [Suhomyces tanzawaensis NRRL Y-17324]